jgi:hypothetical protein
LRAMADLERIADKSRSDAGVPVVIQTHPPASRPRAV